MSTYKNALKIKNCWKAGKIDLTPQAENSFLQKPERGGKFPVLSAHVLCSIDGSKECFYSSESPFPFPCSLIAPLLYLPLKRSSICSTTASL
ncbi:hypothetical protein EO95_18470 [Methanosarcina sp. 1.H.T.1A.1]|nr:hypothetical protein EO95_18470 [Methanosarcina sp. 1.H.T.1A.1]